MLENIREFKKKFYPISWAKYDLAKPGTFILIPSIERIQELSIDFNNMKKMLNDNEFKSFDELIKKIKLIEQEINLL